MCVCIYMYIYFNPAQNSLLSKAAIMQVEPQVERYLLYDSSCLGHKITVMNKTQYFAYMNLE